MAHVLNLHSQVRGTLTCIEGRPPTGTNMRIARPLERVLRVREWNMGLTALRPEDLVCRQSQSRGSVFRPRVEWLPKPWFVRYQADPFLLEDDGRLFLYYEELLFGSRRGRLRGTELTTKRDHPGRGKRMVTLQSHASYPYVFKYLDAFYCIPETTDLHEVALFRSETPGGPWKKQCTILAGIEALDSTVTLFKNRWWLFCTLAGAHAQSQWTDLHIWHAPQPWGPWEPHQLQPVKVDIHSSRPAGRPFIVDGTLYRPAQDCSPRYGARIAINRILTLTPSEFAEEVWSYVEPDPLGPCSKGLHTLTWAGGLAAVDGLSEGPSLNPYKVGGELLIKVLGRLSRLRARQEVLQER